MPRLFVNDVTRRDPRALITTEKLARISSISAPDNQYLYASGDNQITLLAGCMVTTNSGAMFEIDTNAILGPAALDTGSAFAVGTDYHIYICDTGDNADDAVILISSNATAPVGYNSLTARKIGGFHYGGIRAVNATLDPINSGGVVMGTGWESNVKNAIVPRSVWTLLHRPKCNPAGMVYVTSGFWSDIYIASDNGNGGLKSAYNKAPITGTEGVNKYKFVELALKTGKRLPTYDEFLALAAGSPEGLAENNNNAWTAGINLTGRNPTGQIANAVSAVGVRDAVGNVEKYLNDYTTNASPEVWQGSTASGTFTYADGGRAGQQITGGTGHGTITRHSYDVSVVGGEWNYDRISPFPGYGNIYQYYDASLVTIAAGGHWFAATNAGSRTLFLARTPWVNDLAIGAILVCDAM